MPLAKKPPTQRNRTQYYKQPNTVSVPHGYTPDESDFSLPYGGRFSSGPEQDYRRGRPQLMSNVLPGRGSSDAGRSPMPGRKGDGE